MIPVLKGCCSRAVHITEPPEIIYGKLTSLMARMTITSPIYLQCGPQWATYINVSTWRCGPSKSGSASAIDRVAPAQ